VPKMGVLGQLKQLSVTQAALSATSL